MNHIKEKAHELVAAVTKQETADWLLFAACRNTLGNLYAKRKCCNREAGCGHCAQIIRVLERLDARVKE